MSTKTANHMRLDGKVAVITGGAQGVGLGIAQEFVDYGATVIIADINEATLEEAAATLGSRAIPRIGRFGRIALPPVTSTQFAWDATPVPRLNPIWTLPSLVPTIATL